MEKYTNLNLDNQLCFAVYACSREITKSYRPLLEELDITYPQYLVLLVLWEHERLTVKEIGNHLLLDSGTLTPMLKRMEQANLIHRIHDTEDERKRYIILSDFGKSLQEKATCIPKEMAPKFGLTFKEYTELLNMLTKVTNNLLDK
ncbi:MarR family winged helix-turn-helix transcriptional regulator [Bacillus solimangrovi]|uniref:MarR family winged helix-turn-helix transcriptional regulator n=1 Tax=Bacillus solimangrovi TaxID=1305675 RepID=UPI000A53402D|nr:MarR family transcriptional regulator [Bacillus solimangrovi]